MPLSNKKVIIATMIFLATIIILSTFNEKSKVYGLTLQSETTFGGSANDVARAVAIDGAGNKIIVGYTSSFGADLDIFIAKQTDTTSITLWTIDTGVDDLAHGIAITGNFAFIAGTRKSSGSYYDIAIYKWDLTTDTLVSSLFITSGDVNSPFADDARNIIIGGDGNVYVVGRFRDNNSFLLKLDQNLNILGFIQFTGTTNIAFTLGFNKEADTDFLYIGGSAKVAGDRQASLIKLDAATLSIVWQSQLSVTGINIEILSLSIFNDVIYIGGIRANDGYIAAINNNGGYLWGRGTVFSGSSIIRNLVATSSGIYAVGYYNNPPNQDDAIIIQVDANSALVSSIGYGKGTIDRAFGVVFDGTNLHVVGTTATYPNNVYTPSMSFSFIAISPAVATGLYWTLSHNSVLTTGTPSYQTFTPTVTVTGQTISINSPTGVEAFILRFT